jgi:flagellum-specific ATP synthase
MPPIRPQTSRPIYGDPLPPLDRAPIAERLGLGVRALDAFIPCGCGQRLGIFAGAGVGKSMLLGAIAKSAAADVVVLALVGERGREVGQFVEEILGAEALAHTVVVVATSDRPPPERVRAAFVATTIAEYFRDAGKKVLLFVDSLTRFAMAQREVGLAVGEPPTTKGYPPSTFAVMPQLLERAAPARNGGSITGFYAVLVEGDDLSDPIADSARSLLDGHIVLSRRLAERGHFPAVDVLQSLSRLETQLCPPAVLNATRKVRGWLARVEESRDLISVGAYRAGADPELDRALRQTPSIERFLRQPIGEIAPTEETLAELARLTEAE